jgi:hypothetical protein
MTLRDAIIKVLSKARGDMSPRDIWNEIERRGWFESTGETPWATVGSILYTDRRTFRKARKGRFVLARRRDPVGTGCIERPSRNARRHGTARPGRLLDAICRVLSDAGTALDYREINNRVLKQGLWSTKGRTPDLTVRSYLYVHKELFRRIDSRTFALRRPLSDRAHAIRVVSDGAQSDTDSSHTPKPLGVNDRITNVELGLRELVRQATRDDPKLLPPHVAKKVNDRLQSAGHKQGRIGIEHTSPLATRLQYCDLRDLQDVITNSELWPRFASRFANKETLCTRFGQIADLRNSLAHPRVVDEIVLKEGEAALLWFERLLETRTAAVVKPTEATNA